MPLTLHPDEHARHIYRVHCRGACIGVILADVRGDGKEWWSWHLNGVSTKPPQTFMNGAAESKDEADRQLAVAFRAWCDLAGLMEKPE